MKVHYVLMRSLAHREWNVLWAFVFCGFFMASKLTYFNFFLSHCNCGIYSSLLMFLVSCEMNGILISVTTLLGILLCSCDLNRRSLRQMMKNMHLSSAEAG